MEKRHLKVTVDYTDNNFCGGIYDDTIVGVVSATGKTFELFKKEFEEGLKFHIQGNLERGESLPEDIVNGEYEIVYGEKKARPDKREKIINGLHEIGRQALAFV